MAIYCITAQAFRKLFSYEIAEVQDSEDPPKQANWFQENLKHLAGALSFSEFCKKKRLHIATFSFYKYIQILNIKS